MNPFNQDTPLIRTEFSSPSSVLIRGVSLYLHLIFCACLKVKGAERPYESVSDIKENGDAPVKEEELYAGPRSEGGSDYYASVGECGVEYTKRDGTKEIIKTKKELDNEEETYVQAPGPPVPKKNFEPISIDTNTISPPSPQCPQQQSPELPPRNTLSQSTVVSPPSAVTSPANSEAVSLVSSPNSPPIVNNIQNVSNDPAQQPQGAGISFYLLLILN